MATITRRSRLEGGYSYRVQIRRKGNPALSKSFDTRRDANEWARENDREAKLAEAFADARGRGKTLSDLIDRYMAEYNGRDTARVPRLAWWKQKIGTTKLPTVTPDLIADALDDLRASYEGMEFLAEVRPRATSVARPPLTDTMPSFLRFTSTP